MICQSKLIAAALLMGLLCFMSAPASGQRSHENTRIYIEADSHVGNDYTVGYELCKAINAKQSGLVCTLRESGDPRAGLAAASRDSNVFAFARADLIQPLSQGKHDGSAAEFADLRQLATLYPQVLTLVTLPNSGIDQIGSLQGKTISTGAADPGLEALLNQLQDKSSDASDQAPRFKAMDPAELSHALCNRKIDAFFYFSSHPNAVVQNAAAACAAVIVPIEGTQTDRFVGSHQLYSKIAIPGGLYQNNPADIPSLSVSAYLVTSKNTADETVQQVLTTLHQAYYAIAKESRAWHYLPEKRLHGQNDVLPLHPGTRTFLHDNALQP